MPASDGTSTWNPARRRASSRPTSSPKARLCTAPDGRGGGVPGAMVMGSPPIAMPKATAAAARTIRATSASARLRPTRHPATGSGPRDRLPACSRSWAATATAIGGVGGKTTVLPTDAGAVAMACSSRGGQAIASAMVGTSANHRPKPIHGARQARLHRPGRHIQDGRHFTLGEVRAAAQRDDPAIVITEPIDGGQELCSLLPSQDRHLGRRGRAVRGAILCTPQRQAGPPTRGTPPIACCVRDDAQQPGARFGPGPKPVERPVGSDEPFLRRVPSVVGIAADQVGGSEGELLVSAHKLLVGGDVPASRLLDQFRIGQWTALHLVATRTPIRDSRFPLPSIVWTR